MYNPLGKCKVVVGRYPDRHVVNLVTEPTGCSGIVCGVSTNKRVPVSVFLDDVGNLECYYKGKKTEDFSIIGKIR